MANKDYTPCYISHVRIDALKAKWDNQFHYRPIVLKYKDYVVIETYYMDFTEDSKLPADFERIGDLDLNGNGLMKVPAKYIDEALDAETMYGISECLEADARLLSYAR